MNYRHTYHAGNFADVLKHATLVRIVEYLKQKPAPFRVIDTHAGRGRYALASREARKTGEWERGIGRLLGPGAEPLPQAAQQALAPYLDAMRAENPSGGINIYPGSPCLVLRLMRPDDMLVANELHPEERGELERALGRDRRVKVMALDGWVALKSLLPPKERRGIVLVDPPFEEEGEFARLAHGLAQGLERFATGVFVLWYPIKDEQPVARFHRSLADLRVPKLLCIELLVRRPSDPDRLNGCGLIVANPPYTLKDELAAVLPELSRRLGDARGGGRHRLEWIAQPAGQMPPGHRAKPPRSGGSKR